MEVYKLGKTIENQAIEIQLSLHQLNEARDELKRSLKRRKEIAIQENDTQYKEMQNNGTLFEEVRNLKRIKRSNQYFYVS